MLRENEIHKPVFIKLFYISSKKPSKTPKTKNTYFDYSSPSDNNLREHTNKRSPILSKPNQIDACLDEIIKLSALLFNNMRLRAVSVSNDDLEAYLDEAIRTQINYSYFAQDDDASATLMIKEYEKLLSKYKEKKKELLQSSRPRTIKSQEYDNDDEKLIEKLEESLNFAENMIKELN